LLGEEAGPIFAIQVGSFMVKADCETVLADLQARGYPAYVLQIKDGERLLHRIHVGPYPTFSAAEDAAKQFILEEEIDAIPIRARSGPVGPAKPVEDDTQIAEG
jgi:cell division septation protein DedD